MSTPPSAVQPLPDDTVAPGPVAAQLQFQLNGRTEQPTEWSPTTTLLSYLRSTGRTGTKEGCAEGDCGACAVVVSEGGPEQPAWRLTNSCVLLMGSLHRKQVLSVEGLAGPGGALHPAQTAMVEALGSQCGYCTPGFVMSLFEATYRPALATPGWRREDQLAGNLCRCTGYRPIRDALDTVAGACPRDRFAAAVEQTSAPEGLHARLPAGDFLQPVDLSEALALRAARPEARVVAGATDVGLEITMRGRSWPAVLSLEGVAALRALHLDGSTLVVGATTRLSVLEDATADLLPAVHRMLRYFGARAIKNRGTVGGNLCTASPIGDLAPVLLAHDAQMRIDGPRGARTVPAAAFWTGYRTTAVGPDELLTAVAIPLPGPDHHHAAYKVSRRRELDISTVSGGFAMRLDPEGRAREVRLAFGGVAATPLRVAAAEAALEGARFDARSVQAAAEALDANLRPLSDHRASASYRLRLAKNLLLGFLLERRTEALRAGTRALPPRHTGTLALETAAGDPA